ncbi:MAG: hypothetical protein ACPG5B_07605 [Chitinophagales bacterium]
MRSFKQKKETGLQNKKNQSFQDLWKKFESHHKTEGYQLKNVFDIYLPFWQCKQNVVIEKEVELDRLSRIILELIDNDISKHSAICDFLGIDEDNFVTMQFHFLLKNDLIREIENDAYEITRKGIDFLQNKTKIKNIETIEFEYFVTENMRYLKNDLTQDFFDPRFPIDKGLSKKRQRDFSGYDIMQSHKIHKSETAKEIRHRNKPTYRQVNDRRNDFSNFFNEKFKDKSFYDFADSNLEAHKRNICFYGLLFENEENEEEQFLEIRHSSESVKTFRNEEIEKKLGEKATHFLKKNPRVFD